MAHIRKLIRDNIVSSVTGLTTTGQRVYKSRVYPINENSLPALTVYTLSEESQYNSLSPPRSIYRILTVAIEAYVKAVSSYDDVIDTICAEVETALFADLSRGGYAFDTKITGVEIGFSGDGDQPLMTARMSVEVYYSSTEGSPIG